MLKRMFDIAVSAVALVALTPAFAAIAAMVVIDSGLPILFAQERVGRRFRKFRVWKFRTMNTDYQGLRITVEGDRRVTRAGSVLRRTKLDELPQLWNVLIGDMSMVGPRPEVPYYVEMRRAEYEKVLRVRPGITCPASLRFRNEETLLAQAAEPELYYNEVVLPEKLRISERYIESQSLAGDCAILARTVLAIVSRPARELQTQE